MPTNECLLVCPNSYWADKAITQDCIACESGCSLCFGAGYNACTRCRIDNASVPYYKVRYVDSCVPDCPAGDYEIFASLECAACHDSCVLCNTSALDCQKCRNSSGVTYFYYNNECLITCPVGFWGYRQNNTCEICQPQCPSCFDNFTDTCYSCTTFNSTPYYLEYSTTICSTTCPYGQYRNLT